MKTIKLERNENIVACEPKYCAGPGWANAPLWIHIVDHVTQKHRAIAIQPDEQTPEMMALFKVTVAANDAMMGAIEKYVKRTKGKDTK